MARKEKEITIEEGRDAGKTFKITEMGAVQANKWIIRALGVFGKSGTDFNYIRSMDMESLLQEFVKTNYAETEPLLDELLSCVSFVKDGVSVAMKGNMIDSVIEDWGTIFRLQLESLMLNIGFLEQGGESTSE